MLEGMKVKLKINRSQKLLLRREIEVFAKTLGFDLVGFSPAKIAPKYKAAFRSWLKNQHHTDMAYMEKIQERFNMQKVLPGAKTVIALGTNYYREQAPLKIGHGRVARYAYGRDYHKVIGKRLKELEKFIGELAAGNQSKSYVDTGPLMERALAEQAGIGRIGKNGCVISKEFGSWIFLSEVITTLDLNANSGRSKKSSTLDRWSSPQEKSFNVCGNCTRCITACPTGAIIAPGVVDSRLCISYLTIEKKGKISLKLGKIIGKTKRLFGCDICQEVCPHNTARQRKTTVPQTVWPKIAGDQVNIKKIKSLKTKEQFIKTFAGSPLMRWKLPKFNLDIFKDFQ